MILYRQTVYFDKFWQLYQYFSIPTNCAKTVCISIIHEVNCSPVCNSIIHTVNCKSNYFMVLTVDVSILDITEV